MAIRTEGSTAMPTGGFMSAMNTQIPGLSVSQPMSSMSSMKPMAEVSTQTISLQEKGGKESVQMENFKYSSLVSHIEGRYTRAKESRLFDESRWLLAYRNHRGLYGPEVQFSSTEKSRAFVRATAMKVNAAVSQITEVLFADNRFPIGVFATSVPLGIAQDVHFDPKEQDPTQGPTPQGPQTSATIARPELMSLGPLTEKLAPVKDKLKEGSSGSPTAANYSPAEVAADLMDRKIRDQLEEANASKSLRALVFEFTLLGTGVFKGPILKNKEYPKWDQDGQYTPVNQTIADVQHVSLWDAYPDPEARRMEECEYFIQRHRLSKSQLRNLKKRPFFREESIDIAISQGENYIEEYWEVTLRDNKNKGVNERFEVLEYWGLCDSDLEDLTGLKRPKEFDGLDEVQINAWICNGQILRLVYNPYTPVRIPYYIAPYDLNPYSIFGIGIGEKMADTQLLMNGFIRLLIDNGILSSNIVFEVSETTLSPGQDFDIYPGKTFKTQGQPGQSIFSHKFPNVTQECILAFDKFRQIADEDTGLPSYAHGVSGVMSTGRTAAGMSMLMGAADKGIKSVIRNLDDYLFTPLGKALYAFNMQFDFSEKFIGDLDIVALGTDSLMRNEVRSQKLLQFLQMTANPMDAPYTKRSYFLREIAKCMDLDPEKCVNDEREAMIQAEMMKALMLAQGIDPNAQPSGAQGNPAGAPSVNDATGNGGGNIAPGQAQGPGAAGFTGSGGGQNSAPPQAPQGLPTGAA